MFVDSTCGLGISVLLVSAGSVSGFQPQFQPLGTLPGSTQSFAQAISADGSTIVGYADLRAFRWTRATGMQELVPPPGTAFIHALAVSGDGSVVVGRMLGPTGSRAFRWRAETGTVDLGVPAGSIQSWGTGISADGLVISGYVEINPKNSFRWTEAGGFQLLGTLPGGQLSSLCYPSGDGSVIAGESGSAEGTRAFRWTALTGMQSLGVPAGFTTSNATAVSVDGQVIVGSLGAGAGVHGGFYWNASTGMHAVPNFDGFYGVSGDGRVLVGGYPAHLWTASRGLTRLQTLLGQAVPAGYGLERALSVSADGLRITGWANNPDGRPEAYLVTLTPDMLVCYANCDESTVPPILNVNDFVCFINRFAAGSPAANCDGSTLPPVLNVNDYVCFMTTFAAGCP